MNIDCSDGIAFRGRWIERMWKGKSAYDAKGGVDEYMQFREDQQTEEYKASVEQLAENHSRTNDLVEYHQHANVFRIVSPNMVNQAYSEDVMHAKRRKENRRQQFFRSIANRVLSMSHAIAPGKQGAPVIVIGKATFSSTMKGKRAAPVKKVVEYLSKFFTVLLVGEHNISQFCSQCKTRLQDRPNTIRLYDCNCSRSDGGGTLIVNKDRSAPLAMIFIVANLLAYGSRPLIYRPTFTGQDTA